MLRQKTRRASRRKSATATPSCWLPLLTKPRSKPVKFHQMLCCAKWDLKSVGSQYTFRFADYTMVRDVEVFVPAEQSPSEDYEVMLLDSVYWAKGEHPGLELGALRVGPAAAVKAASDYWHGCNLRALWVFGQGQELFWYVSCELPEGVETGTVDSQSGVYQPWSAPPAPTPPNGYTHRLN